MRFLKILVLALVTVTTSEAQTDPVKALVGKWEGEVQLRGRGDPNRTLIIESVTERDGRWVAEGRYGITGQGFGKVQIDVDRSGRWPSIRFATGANSTVRLDLVDEKSMAGTMTLAGTSQHGNDRSMRLRKIE
jgi:hypothetical protein